MRILGFSHKQRVDQYLGSASSSSRTFAREIEMILDQARWAPSGDNTQPWRFEIVDDSHLIVHLLAGHMREVDFYSRLDERSLFLVGGVLLETMRIAASSYHRSLIWTLGGEDQGVYRIAVTLAPDPAIAADALAPFIRERSVNRYAYQGTRLTPAQKQRLGDALGQEFRIVWRESLSERWRAASLNTIATDIRLRIPETFETHKHAIDWQSDFSESAIPARAVGLDRLSLVLMRWLMSGDWKRLDLMNRFAGGTLLARIELDLLPGLACGAHFIICRTAPASSLEAQIHAGQALQRFWLAATAAGLVMQPSYATLLFALSAQNGLSFTADRRMLRKAAVLRERLAAIAGTNLETIVLLGRLGTPRARRLRSRSVRQPLEELLV